MFVRTNTGDNSASRLTRCDVPPASIETKKTRGRTMLPPICYRGLLQLQLQRRRRRRHRRMMHKPTMYLPSMALTFRPLLPETQGPSLCPPPLLASRRRRKCHRRSKERCSVSFPKREAEVDRRRAQSPSHNMLHCTVRRRRRTRPRQLPPRPLLLQRPLPTSTCPKMSLQPQRKGERKRRRPMRRISRNQKYGGQIIQKVKIMTGLRKLFMIGTTIPATRKMTKASSWEWMPSAILWESLATHSKNMPMLTLQSEGSLGEGPAGQP